MQFPFVYFHLSTTHTQNHTCFIHFKHLIQANSCSWYRYSTNILFEYKAFLTRLDFQLAQDHRDTYEFSAALRSQRFNKSGME